MTANDDFKFSKKKLYGCINCIINANLLNRQGATTHQASHFELFINSLHEQLANIFTNNATSSIAFRPSHQNSLKLMLRIRTCVKLKFSQHPQQNSAKQKNRNQKCANFFIDLIRSIRKITTKHSVQSLSKVCNPKTNFSNNI